MSSHGTMGQTCAKSWEGEGQQSRWELALPGESEKETHNFVLFCLFICLFLLLEEGFLCVAPALELTL